MRFFTGMNSGVYGQGRSLNELLLATRIITHVRSNPAVDSFYIFLHESNVPIRGEGKAYRDAQGRFDEQILYYMWHRRMP